MKTIKYLFILVSVFIFTEIQAQNLTKTDTSRVNLFEVETGAFATINMEFKGFNQENATENWKAYAPTLRLEYWNKREQAWNYGLSIQPIYFKYDDLIKHDLNYDGKVFHQGENATLTYQFHNITTTANYALIGKTENNYFRLGGTLIFRYADFRFIAQTSSFHSRNFIVFPLINTEFKVRIKDNLFFFSRADFLPSPTKRVFSDGLFNVLFSVRNEFANKKSLDIGTRLFFGGDDEQQPDDYANRIFFFGLVAKYTFGI